MYPSKSDDVLKRQNYATTPWTFSLGGRVLQKGVYITPSSDKSQAVSIVSTVSNVNSISETLYAADVDTGDTQSWSIVDSTGTYGSLSLNGNGGQWSYTVDNSRTQALAEGEVATETFVARVADNNGASADQTITVTVTGTNDAPVATYTTANIATEDGQIISGVLTSTDVDVLGTTASYALVGSAIPGLAINANGNWSFDPSNSAYQSLAVDQTLPITVTYAVTDNRGASNQQSFTITVTGTNDAPTVSVGNQSAPLVEAGGSTNTTAGTPTATIALTRVDLDGSTPTFLPDSSWVESRKRALDFDGINDFVAIPTNTQLPSTNSAYTLEAWIKPDTTGALGIIGWGNWGASNQSNALRLTGSDQLVNYWWGNDLRVTAGNLADGRWHHVAATFDGTVRRIFVDGVQKGFDTPTGLNVASTISNARIGSTNNGEYFDGAIDDVGIWNRALSQAEITARQTTPPTGGETGLLAFYGLNDTAGTVAANTGSSAAALNGTVNGPVWVESVVYNKAGVYGTASLNTTTGVVSYLLDNSSSVTQALISGQRVTENFGTLSVQDVTGASATSTPISFTISGSNDGPWVSGELLDATANELGINNDRTTQASTDAVGAAGSLWASGVYDPEADAMALQVANADVRTHTGTYGALTVNRDGSYRYVVNNSNTAVNALREDESLDDVFSLNLLDTSSGLSSNRALRIRIDGTDDRPRSTGSLLDIGVDEAGLTAGTNSVQPASAAFGNLQDPEGDIFTQTVTAGRTADGSFAPVPLNSASSSGLVLVGNYGNLTIGADGSYT